MGIRCPVCLTPDSAKTNSPAPRSGASARRKGGARMPAKLVSVINMKGGVGKSTTTVSLAETLAAHQRRRVLVIDLDPQTNASIMVAGPDKWNALREKERTLDFYFESYIIQQKPKPFKSLVDKGVSDLKGK